MITFIELPRLEVDTLAAFLLKHSVTNVCRIVYYLKDALGVTRFECRHCEVSHAMWKAVSSAA